MRQHRGVGLGVGKIEGTTENMADLVVEAGPCRGKRHRGKITAIESFRMGRTIAGISMDTAQRTGQGPGPLQGIDLIDRISLGRPEGIHAVGHGIEHTGHSQIPGQGGHQISIIDNSCGQHPVIQTGAFAALFCHSPHVGGLRAGIGGGYRNDRNGSLQGNGLGQPGGGTTTDGHNQINIRPTGCCCGTSRQLRGNMLGDFAPLH